LPGLKIPPDSQRGLRKLCSLTIEAADRLLSAIKSAAKKVESGTIDPLSLPVVPGIPQSDVVEIAETIVSLYQVRAGADVSVEEFVSDVCDFLLTPESQEFHISEKEVAAVTKRLVKVLNVDVLSLSAKAAVLRYEHERTLCSVRILTDARPVYGNDPTEAPRAIVIFHMLKIAYHETEKVKELYFSLDEIDLESLKTAVLRAELKAASLKQALAAADIAVID
jgi:hypothetical protein